MGTLNRDELRRRFDKGELISNPRRNEQGEYDIEPASYDMVAGTFIWKEADSPSKKGSINKLFYEPEIDSVEQQAITLHPGQMMFVITREEVLMPDDLVGTVYSRNKLAREGILALNAGHIDPGYTGPIAIRLINLRAIPYLMRLGEPIYTIVFHELYSKQGDKSVSHHPISMEETIDKYTESACAALSNALYDLSLMHDFLRKDEFGDALWAWLKNNTAKVIVIIGAIATFLVALSQAIPALIALVKKLFN